MLWESPAQLSLSLRPYKRGAPLSITPWHFAPPPLCLQLIHTRNMLTLPFMVFFHFQAKPNFVSIHCCSLGQNCQLECKVCLKWRYAPPKRSWVDVNQNKEASCSRCSQYKIDNATSVAMSSELAGHASVKIMLGYNSKCEGSTSVTRTKFWRGRLLVTDLPVDTEFWP